MPIPPRPIPNPHAHSHSQRRHSRRPEVNLAGGGQSLINECRADMAILPRGASAPNTLSGVFVRPRSFSPLHSPLGSSPLHPSPISTTPLRTPTPPTPPRIEVPLAQLMDGRGRAPRTGAAAAMGFDFVARPTVIPIEDDKITEPQPAEPRSSFWAWRERYRATHSPAEAAPPPDSMAGDPPLGTSPQTPALEPHVTDDEDDWEHVDAEDDADPVLGELELDAEIVDACQVPTPTSKGTNAKAVRKASELSGQHASAV